MHARRTLVPRPRARNELEPPASHLLRSATVYGLLEAEGELFIDGRVKGLIHAERLVVGQNGNVEGDVVASDVRISGRMKGRVFAFRVLIDASADFDGRVFHHELTVERGARIEGRMPWRPLNYFEAFEKPPENQL
jgi:cytoskeletal protein CcmA (bactofilin family)